MLKLTSYKKIKLSRNILLLILVCCFVGVGGKIYFAHEKLNDYQEAIRLYNNGEMRAAEKKFIAANLNPFVKDHNEDISLKLSILSPVIDAIERIDKDAKDAYEDDQLQELVVLHQEFVDKRQKWHEADAVKKDIFEEMLAFTKIDKDFERYFQTKIKSLYATLESDLNTDDEANTFNHLQLIPHHYFGGEKEKEKEISSVFTTYYKAKLDALITKNSFSPAVSEGERQFAQLKEFSIDNKWLQKKLDSYLISELKSVIEAKDYDAYATNVKTIQKLKSNLEKSGEIFQYINATTTNIVNKAQSFVTSHQYEQAISIYTAIMPLQNTKELIAEAEIEWDLHEPIRVLTRMKPDIEIINHKSGRNNWSADSYITAISSDNSVYFGMLNRGEEMTIIEGSLTETPITDFEFFNQLSVNGNPVIYFESHSDSRKHRYVAYEVYSSTIEKILDIEADNFTIESPHVLLVDNAVGSGEGELAYFEPTYNGFYEFIEIKVDYIDINVEEIESYRGVKVRFDAYIESEENNGSALVAISSEYNEETYLEEYTYLLLNTGDADFYYGNYYTVIGTFTKYQDIDIDGEIVKVPVLDVEEYE